MEKLSKSIAAALCSLITITVAVMGWYYAALPTGVSVEIGARCSGGFSAAEIRGEPKDCTYYLGAIPIKSVDADEKERPMLIPCGTPFGIRLRSDGVMVVSVTKNSPADGAGIKTGDIITEINGNKICENADITESLQAQSSIIITRGESTLCVNVCPQSDSDGELRIGAWVRDSAAGIGTLTFCEPNSLCFGGLGHAVNDETTHAIVPLGGGDITAADIFDVVRGEKGAAGELCGVILSKSSIGELFANTSLGVFGTIDETPSGKAIPMAFRQEVECGAASILTTIDGNSPREYSIEIERVNLFGMNGSKGMLIRVTDSELLETTGGIVRGMSGSPIIQNGRLVGAVTHVCVNL